MSKYYEFEEKVFEWLMNKHRQNPEFTFSLRQMASKGAEGDYFIGTEKSNYFATTFWYIRVNYPGNAQELISVLFKITREEYSYSFQFLQTRSPKDGQNKLGLELIKTLRPAIKGIFLNFYEGGENSKMESFGFNSHQYTDIDKLLIDAAIDLDKVIPIVDDAIAKLKNSNPEFRAERYNKARFDSMLEKMEARKSKNQLNDIDKNKGNTGTVQAKENFGPPLNKILFGPPGTGKTYAMQQMVEEMNLEKKVAGKFLDFKSFVDGYHWWEIIAMVLLDFKLSNVPSILSHELVKAKLSLSNIQHPPQRVWSTLQNHTVENCSNVKFKGRHGELIFFKEKNSDWRLDNIQDFKEQFPYLVEEWNNFKNSATQSTVEKNYFFTTCHQSLSYEDFMEGIKPVLSQSDKGVDAEKEIQYEIRKGIFYQACENAAQLAGYENLKIAMDDTKEHRVEKFQRAIKDKKVFVLFLDEINRTNVSAMFGELITLIEDDKRLGAENEMADTILPYSQTRFGVPLNLFLVGTMNTADRSVEALDTALRRRFVFEEMKPRPELVSPQRMIWKLWWDYEDFGWEEEEYLKVEKPLYKLLGVSEEFDDDDTKEETWVKMKDEGKGEDQKAFFHKIDFSGINFQFLLEKINERVEKVLSKDQQIGHAFLMNVLSIENLYEVFYQKIIPQLQEYFYGDFGKIGLILGKGFISEEIKSVQFADFDYDDKDLLAERKVYGINLYKNGDEINWNGFSDAITSIYLPKAGSDA